MNKLKNKFKLGDVDIPECIRIQCTRFFLMAIGVFVLGLTVAIISLSLVLVLASIVLASIIAGMGYYRLYKVSYDGYEVVTGKCDKIEYTLKSRVGGKYTKDIPSRYLIRSESNLYAIPYFKQNPVVNEGDVVNLYLIPNAGFIEIRGARNPNGILGYEVISTEESIEE